MCCTRLAGNTGCKNDAKNCHLCTIAQLRCTVSSQLRHVLTIGKKLLNNNMSSTSPRYGELRLRSVPDFGAPQQISTGFASCLHYCSGIAHRRPTKLCTMFGRLLRCDRYTIYTFLKANLTEFCPVQNSLYVQVLHSRTLEALLHGTPAAVVSQTLRRGIRNGITERLQRAPRPPIFGRAAITLGIGPHSSCLFVS